MNLFLKFLLSLLAQGFGRILILVLGIQNIGIIYFMGMLFGFLGVGFCFLIDEETT